MRSSCRVASAAATAAILFGGLAASCTSEPQAIEFCEITSQSDLLDTPPTPYHRRLHHEGRERMFEAGDTYATTDGCGDGDRVVTDEYAAQ